MLIPEGGTPGEIVINQCVLQQVVTHVESVDGLTPDEAAFSQSLPPGEGPRQISSVTASYGPALEGDSAKPFNCQGPAREVQPLADVAVRQRRPHSRGRRTPQPAT
jgi:hypothetical protein